MTHSYPDSNEAARGLLVEACTILNNHGVDYAVIGGWIPHLFYSAKLGHPGTYDVDVVLNDAVRRKVVIEALDKFVAEEYMLAPKNAFQVYRVLNVGGKKTVFHVDFLHRKYADDTDGLIRRWGPYESISGPGTDVIFLEKEVRYETIDGTMPSGNATSIRVPFATEAGFIGCKGRSVGLGKRSRDAYDLFLIVSQSVDRSALETRCCQLMAKNQMFVASFFRMKNEFKNRTAIQDAADHLLSCSPSFDSPVEHVEREMFSFFEAVERDRYSFPDEYPDEGDEEDE